MHERIWRLLGRLAGQDRALENARVAATRLSRRRVERLEVELYLEQRRSGVSKTA